MTSNQDIRKIRTKKKLQCALVNILKRKDIHEVKIKDLTDAANISRQTFYRHYEMVEDLFSDCVDDLFIKLQKDMSKLLDETKPRDDREMIIQTFQAFHQNRENLLILFSLNDRDLIIDNLHRQFELSYQAFDELEYTPPDKSSLQYLLIRYKAGGLYAVLKEWLTRKKDCSPQEMAEIYIEILGQHPLG